jgi:uncharacterized OB-fold protein
MTALTAPYVLQYSYKRSVGPVLGRFFAALRDGRLEGVRTRDGRVLMPPAEYDESGHATGDPVALPPVGTVTTWAWVAQPRRNHPLDRPFAWALIRIDGADTALLHAVDAGAAARMRTGMRVRARFRPVEARTGHIRDLECFAPDDDARTEDAALRASEPVRGFVAPIRLEYTVNAGRAATRFLRGLQAGRILGQRCPVCRKVNVPPRGACTTCGVPTAEEVLLPDIGTITTFCIINIPFEAQALELPYACASILLDGADTTLFHLLQEVPVAEIRMGMRVRAVWHNDADRTPSLASIRHFRPAGEPDAPYEAYRRHLG